MTPEARAQWEQECRAADRDLAKKPLSEEEIAEDVDKYAMPKPKRIRTEEEKEKAHERYLSDPEYYNRKHMEWYYRNRATVLAKEKARRIARAKKKAALSLQTESGK
jgi:superfamily II DNA or RNA helicase